MAAALGQELLRILPRLRCAEALLTREEARLLAWMHAKDAKQQLGSTSFGDMVREWLHITPRTARERLALHRRLASAPRLEQAFLTGAISVCQIQAISPLLRDDDGGEEVLLWFSSQGRCTVRELRRRAWKERRERAEAARQADAATKWSEREADYNETDPEAEPSLSVRLDVPLPVTVEWEHTMELARAQLGWDAPLYNCVEVMLIEAAPEAIALTPSHLKSIAERDDRREGDEAASPQVPPRHGTAASLDRPSLAPCEPSPPATLRDPLVLPVPVPSDLPRPLLPPLPGGETRARKTLRSIREYLDDLQDLVESGEPSGAYDALERVRRVQLLVRSARAFLAALLRDLRDTRFLDQLGCHGMEEFCRRELGMSDRAARLLRREADHFQDSPELESAFGEGRIGSAHVARIARLAGGNPLLTGAGADPQKARLARWVDRASQVTVRQFDREVRFLQRLQEASPALAWMCNQPLPNPSLEAGLMVELSIRKWPRARVETTLRRFGLDAASIASAEHLAGSAANAPRGDGAATAARAATAANVPTGTGAPTAGHNAPPIDPAHDPACNHLLMVRLEALLNLLVLASSEEPLHEGSSILRTLALGGEIHSGRRKTFATLPAPADPVEEPSDQRALRGWGTISFSAPRTIVEHWTAALHLARTGPEPLPAWAGVVALLRSARQVWEAQDPARVPRQRKILHRDEIRCRFPGCTRRAQLQVHHADFRSNGGSDDPENKLALCAAHHAMRHAGLFRVHGTAPGAMLWEVGLRPGPPLRTYLGDARIEG